MLSATLISEKRGVGVPSLSNIPQIPGHDAISLDDVVFNEFNRNSFNPKFDREASFANFSGGVYNGGARSAKRTLSGAYIYEALYSYYSISNPNSFTATPSVITNAASTVSALQFVLSNVYTGAGVVYGYYGYQTDSSGNLYMYLDLVETDGYSISYSALSGASCYQTYSNTLHCSKAVSSMSTLTGAGLYSSWAFGGMASVTFGAYVQYAQITVVQQYIGDGSCATYPTSKTGWSSMVLANSVYNSPVVFWYVATAPTCGAATVTYSPDTIQLYGN